MRNFKKVKDLSKREVLARVHYFDNRVYDRSLSKRKRAYAQRRRIYYQNLYLRMK